MTYVEFDVPSDPEGRMSPFIQKYINTLCEKKVAVIFDPKHFCELVGVEATYAYAVANDSSNNYRLINIRKKSGGFRIIHAPLPTLKLIQRWILDNILVGISVHKSANAYVAGRSIKRNARIHKGQRSVLKLDITAFFPSIRVGEVYRIFHSLGYTRPISTLLAHLCTINGVLPQGAPTSGALANAYMFELDEMALEFCLGQRLRYTRYSDDITISGDNIQIDEIQLWFRENLAKYGFEINGKKTVYRNSGDRLLVTGLVVNEKINVLRKTYAKIRQEYYYLMKFGVYEHAKRLRKSPTYVVDALAGRLAFAIGIRPYDTKLRMMLADVRAIRRDLRSINAPDRPSLMLPGYQSMIPESKTKRNFTKLEIIIPTS